MIPIVTLVCDADYTGKHESTIRARKTVGEMIERYNDYIQSKERCQ